MPAGARTGESSGEGVRPPRRVRESSSFRRLHARIRKALSAIDVEVGRVSRGRGRTKGAPQESSTRHGTRGARGDGAADGGSWEPRRPGSEKRAARPAGPGETRWRKREEYDARAQARRRGSRTSAAGSGGRASRSSKKLRAELKETVGRAQREKFDSVAERKTSTEVGRGPAAQGAEGSLQLEPSRRTTRRGSRPGIEVCTWPGRQGGIQRMSLLSGGEKSLGGAYLSFSLLLRSCHSSFAR